jgi:hypothetical protein
MTPYSLCSGITACDLFSFRTNGETLLETYYKTPSAGEHSFSEQMNKLYI